MYLLQSYYFILTIISTIHTLLPENWGSRFRRTFHPQTQLWINYSSKVRTFINYSFRKVRHPVYPFYSVHVLVDHTPTRQVTKSSYLTFLTLCLPSTPLLRVKNLSENQIKFVESNIRNPLPLVTSHNLSLTSSKYTSLLRIQMEEIWYENLDKEGRYDRKDKQHIEGNQVSSPEVKRFLLLLWDYKRSGGLISKAVDFGKISSKLN